ncbi:hypothetical protein K504DRAFT_170845 [Pleomassaria siparia CBS 279.74]|uniref:Secreted protein n=1 Tax=Pleomassaria siparia CBS 279.74 TaxID=1314801 RepID=A0A6G1JT08_9PLEO|nr:hypothetical protein K504DRAFT_170845 [Pleomassaria siparia CBS 279.74]
MYTVSALLCCCCCCCCCCCRRQGGRGEVPSVWLRPSQHQATCRICLRRRDGDAVTCHVVHASLSLGDRSGAAPKKVLCNSMTRSNHDSSVRRIPGGACPDLQYRVGCVCVCAYAYVCACACAGVAESCRLQVESI